MTDESIQESGPCQSKIGLDTQKTGKKSAKKSVLAGQGTVAKEAPLTQIAAPEMVSPIPSLDGGLSLPLPMLTTTPVTARPKTSAHGARDVMSLTTQSTTHGPQNVRANSLVTTDTRRSLIGGNKKPTRQDLLRAIQGDELALQQHAILLEAYKPAMDAIKLYLEIHGSQSPNFYMTKNKQIAAACQMNGLNDPSATRKQRIAAMTCYEMLMEAIMAGIESGIGKEQVKQMMNDAINSAAEFFNLGNKKAVTARMRAQRKAV